MMFTFNRKSNPFLQTLSLDRNLSSHCMACKHCGSRQLEYRARPLLTRILPKLKRYYCASCGQRH